MPSIPYETLVDLAAGRIDPNEAEELRTRIAADASALAQLTALEELIGLMRDDTSVDAPEHLIDRAARLIRRPAARPEAGPLQRLVALLKGDSWRTPLLATGLRAVQAWPRALLLYAGDRELDLQIGPAGGRWQLLGQVLGPEEPGTVELTGPAERVTGQLNELGEFVLPPVRAGRYTLIVTLSAIEIVVPDLEMGPSSDKI